MSEENSYQKIFERKMSAYDDIIEGHFLSHIGASEWIESYVKEALITHDDIKLSAEQMLAPRVLEPDQRFVLCTLVDQDEDLRGKAIFALEHQ